MNDLHLKLWQNIVDILDDMNFCFGKIILECFVYNWRKMACNNQYWIIHTLKRKKHCSILTKLNSTKLKHQLSGILLCRVHYMLLRCCQSLVNVCEVIYYLRTFLPVDQLIRVCYIFNAQVYLGISDVFTFILVIFVFLKPQLIE